MPTQTPSPLASAQAQTNGQAAPRPTPNGTARRPGPPKPVVFKDFASI